MNNANDIRAFGLSQYAATSVTEVSNVDVNFTEAGQMLILYQQHFLIDLLLLIILILAEPSCEGNVIIQKINELTFRMQRTGSRTLEKI